MADTTAVADAISVGDNGNLASIGLERKETIKSTGTASTKDSDLSDGDQPISSPVTPERETLPNATYDELSYLKKLQQMSQQSKISKETKQVQMTGIAIDDEFGGEDIASDTSNIGSSEKKIDEKKLLDNADDAMARAMSGGLVAAEGMKDSRSESEIKNDEKKRSDNADDVMARAMSGGLAAAAGLKEGRSVSKKKKGKLSRLFSSKKIVQEVPPNAQAMTEEPRVAEEEKKEESPLDVAFDEPESVVKTKKKSSTFVAWPTHSAFDESIETIGLAEVAGAAAEEKGLETLRTLENNQEQETTEVEEEEIEEDVEEEVTPTLITWQSRRANYGAQKTIPFDESIEATDPAITLDTYDFDRPVTMCGAMSEVLSEVLPCLNQENISSEINKAIDRVGEVQESVTPSKETKEKVTAEFNKAIERISEVQEKVKPSDEAKEKIHAEFRKVLAHIPCMKPPGADAEEKDIIIGENNEEGLYAVPAEEAKSSDEEKAAPKAIANSSEEEIKGESEEEKTPPLPCADFVEKMNNEEIASPEAMHSANPPEEQSDKEFTDEAVAPLCEEKNDEMPDNYEKMTYRELQKLCKDCGLNTKGSKIALIDRLDEYYDDGECSF